MLDVLLCSFIFSRAERVGLKLPPTFLEEFLSKEVSLLFNRMKVSFHVAGTISPLIILIPSGWSSYQIGRDHLLMVRVSFFLSLNPQQILYALGNDRPSALLDVERDLCNCIMRIMGGSDAETELKRFLEEYDARKLVWAADGTDLGLNFFDNGKMVCRDILKQVH